jgi:hypothetical protein
MECEILLCRKDRFAEKSTHLCSANVLDAHNACISAT